MAHHTLIPPTHTRSHGAHYPSHPHEHMAPITPPTHTWHPSPLLSDPQGVENVYTRHKPLLGNTLDTLIKGKLKEVQFPYVGDHRLSDKCVLNLDQ